jgi:predicted NodU family carbamoyl transferase
VAGHDKVATVEELPVPWGLYVASEDRTKLRRVKQAVPFPDRDIATMRRSFVCAMLRKVTESTVPKKELERLVREAAERERDSSHHGQELKYLQKRLEELGQVLATFKRRDRRGPASGWEGTRKHRRGGGSRDGRAAHARQHRRAPSEHACSQQ